MSTGINAKLTLLKIGHCLHPHAITMRSAPWKAKAFPSLVGLIEHPIEGYILFDTGYSNEFIKATQPLPERFYRYLTPMCLSKEENLLTQLAQKNIKPSEIKHIIISHFHADHIAGLKDFKEASFWCSKSAYQDFQQGSRFKKLLRGYLPNLLPNNFDEKVKFLEDVPMKKLNLQTAAFQTGWDLFGDESCNIIDLPGHAAGHVALLLKQEGNDVFLIGDACWSIEALRKEKLPNPIAYFLFSSKRQYQSSFSNLIRLYNQKNILIIPSHCQESFDRWKSENANI